MKISQYNISKELADQNRIYAEESCQLVLYKIVDLPEVTAEFEDYTI